MDIDEPLKKEEKEMPAITKNRFSYLGSAGTFWVTISSWFGSSVLRTIEGVGAIV